MANKNTKLLEFKQVYITNFVHQPFPFSYADDAILAKKVKLYFIISHLFCTL